MKKIRVLAIASSAVIVGSTIASAPTASASSEWSALQASLPFTVYEAFETFSMPRTEFEVNNDCSSSSSNLAVVYKSSASKKIKLYESSSTCYAGGGSYAPIAYKTFSVQDGAATAEVYPACRTQLECEFPSDATLKSRGAMVRVVLASDGTHASTHVLVKTKGISYTKIKSFVWSLGLP